MLLGGAFLLCSVASWFRTRAESVVLVRPKAIPALIGAAYGTIPAVGFAYSDSSRNSTLLGMMVGILVVLVPLAVPVFMFGHRLDQPAT